MNDCKGCRYESSTDIEVHLEFCTNCKRAYSNEEDREFLYNSRVIRYKREGIEEGTRKGIEQGTKEKEIEIVRNMKEMNYPIEDIKKITGLSIEEIEKI